MDLRDFVALYVTEAQEHLRLLDRALRGLERDDAPGAVDEAFRAAHTLKGLSATMGFRAAADQAHALEDVLQAVRSGARARQDTVADLLVRADALAAEIDHAVAHDEPCIDGWDDPAEAAARDAVGARTAHVPAPADGPDTTGNGAGAPAAGELAVHVALQPDAPVKAARALLVVRAAGAVCPVVRVVPDSFDDDAFTGALTLVVEAGADRAALEAAVRGAGDVATVSFEAAAARAAPRPAVPAAPRPQVRVDQGRLDEIADGIGELTVLQGRLRAELAGRGAADTVDRFAALLADLQHAVLSVRMVPLAEAFERFPRVVRDAARATGKDVDFRVEGEQIEIDRSILDDVVEPLMHLVRNAVDHGIEPPEARTAAGKPARGSLRLSAQRERASVRIVLADDGRGVARDRVIERARAAGMADAAARAAADDDELFRLLAHPGLSTAEQVTELSGRGVGMDVVVSRVRALGGAIDMRTRPGAGTTFTLRLPITLALTRALRVRIGTEDYAVPLTHVTEAVELREPALEPSTGAETLRVRDELLPLVRLRRVLRVAGAAAESAAVIAEHGERRTALAVDEIVGHEQILVKQFDAAPGTLPFFSGATLLADGRPVLVLDPLSVI